MKKKFFSKYYGTPLQLVWPCCCSEYFRKVHSTAIVHVLHLGGQHGGSNCSILTVIFRTLQGGFSQATLT